MAKRNGTFPPCYLGWLKSRTTNSLLLIIYVRMGTNPLSFPLGLTRGSPSLHCLLINDGKLLVKKDLDAVRVIIGSFILCTIKSNWNASDPESRSV